MTIRPSGVVRDYTAQDWPEVCRIYMDAKPAELRYEPARFDVTPLEQDAKLRAAFAESAVLVYEDVGLQGFAATFEGQLRAMFVLGRARGQGVGQALLDAVLSRAPDGVLGRYGRGTRGVRC